MHEGTPLRIGRHLTRRRVLQALDNRSFTGSIVANDDRKWCMKLDDVFGMRVEGTDTNDLEFFDG